MQNANIRALTHGPRQHWFGYYDKQQFDSSSRFLLGMAVDFEGRSPTAADTIEIGMIDLHDGDRWIRLGQSSAWSWQQGCMLQWRPGSAREVLWNDRAGDQYVSHLLDLDRGSQRTLPAPIYTVSPDGTWALGTDFRRINDMRPGYGYAGVADPHGHQLAPADSGIYRLDLATGATTPIVSIAEVAALPHPALDLRDAKHYFNHLLINPDGTRFIFLHRWRIGNEPFQTRMVTAAADGSALHVIDDYGQMSHFIWRDSAHILAWAWHPSHEAAFYLYRDQPDAARTEPPTVIGKGVMTLNGHCTYLADGKHAAQNGSPTASPWILNDNYAAADADRMQHLYRYHIASGRRELLGSFHSPPAYDGEWRCDLHPRSNVTGQYVCIDSAHGGNGRQLYLLDLGAMP